MALAVVMGTYGCSERRPTLQDGKAANVTSRDRGPGAAPRLEASPLPFALDFAVDVAWDAREGRGFVTEKNTGRIRIIDQKQLLPRPCARLGVSNKGLRGLTGIVLHPDFEKTRWLYVYYSATPSENRLTRFVVDGNRCTSPVDVLTGIKASPDHNGGQLEFMDGKLFVTVGDAGERFRAQKKNQIYGKVLRLNDDGSIPDGNPFSRPGRPNPVWSYGHRNPFGLAHRPGTDQLFLTDNGPTCEDELNLVRPGANYGWGPGPDCLNPAGIAAVPPLVSWTPVIVPADLWWYRGEIEGLHDSLLMAEYVAGRIHSFKLDGTSSRVVGRAVVYDGDEKLVDVSQGPDGTIYALTQTRILRLTPAPYEAGRRAW